MAFTQRIAWEKLRFIDSDTFTGSYQALGAPLANPSIMCKLVNNSTSLVTISTDGVNDYDVAPANSFWLYDEDKSGKPFPDAIPESTQFYVKGASGTGLVYLVTQYLITN